MKKTAYSFFGGFYGVIEGKEAEETRMMLNKLDFLEKCNGIRELLVIRGHLSIEYFLNKAIEKFLPNSDKLTSDNNLSFTKKLLIVECFNVLEKDTYKFIVELNKLRNKCAHKLDYEISNKDIYTLGEILPEEISKQTFDEIRKSDYYDLLVVLLSSVLVDMAYCLELIPNKK